MKALLLLLALAGPALADPAAALRDAEQGSTLARAGRFAEAVPLLRQALDADPTKPLVATELGYDLYRLGKLRDAELYLRRALALDPRRAFAYETLALVLMEAPDRWQRRDELVAFFERGLRALDDDPTGRSWVTLRLCGLERAVGLLPRAQRRLTALLATDVPVTLRQQALELQAQIAADERAQSLIDWPDGPPLGEADKSTIKRGETAVRAGENERALTALGPLLERVPEAIEARWWRAHALAGLGRYDQAVRDLTILLQLRPSYAPAWRMLGTILVEHGGTLDAERADDALRHALALQPSWSDLRELRKKAAAKRAPPDQRAHPGLAPAPPATAHAQELLADAKRWRDQEAPEFAEPLLNQALAESPGYVEAAAALFALTGRVPEATLRALWGDPAGLVHLAELLHDLSDGARPTVQRCLDRAVELGSVEARLRRAELRAAAGDRAGALADLTAYVAHDKLERLDEAQSLRATLVPAPNDPRELQAQLALLAERVSEAERVLGGPCRPELPAARLMALGQVEEYGEATEPALACYREAIEAASRSGGIGLHAAQARLAATAARAPLALIETFEAPLRAARKAQIPEADWALARLELQRQHPDEARELVEAFLHTAAPDDPAFEEARELETKLAKRGDEEANRRRELGSLAAIAGLGLALFAVGRRYRGTTVARALVRRPALFPELSRAVAEVRHDVIKHRASVLGLEDGDRENMARSLLEPRPASELVAEIYERVQQAATGLGLTLRALDREPAFGPIARALREAERILREGDPSSLHQLDRELREAHTARLGALLGLGPRTHLDAARLTRWISAVEAEASLVTEPGLLLRQMDVVVGVDEDALYTIFSNLLRNAAQAVADRPDPRILVRVERETDVTGRQLVTLLVADSAPHAPLLADLEARDGQRGLGLVRDLTRKWGGHLAIRNEAAPLVKAIGASFPAPAGTP